MLVFLGSQNAVDTQVQAGCMNLLIALEKNTPTATIQEFFGDGNTASSDQLQVNYVNRLKGPKPIIPHLPIFPLAAAATTGPNHIEFEKDASGKYTKCRFSIEIGVNGALQLGQDSYLSVTTRINDIKTLEISTLDGLPTEVIHTYNAENFKPMAEKDFPLHNVRQIILPPFLHQILFMSNAHNRVVQLSQKEIMDVARSLNDIMIAEGEPLKLANVINGVNVNSSRGLVNQKFYSGGTFYDVIGVADYDMARIVASQDINVYTQRAIALIDL